jgi:NADPH-dependent ferric siderophore reductase
MPLLKKMVGEVFGKFVFRELTVERTYEPSPRFKRVELRGDALRGAAYEPGDKLQIFIDGDMRTYSPFSFDAERGALSLLVYLHAAGTPSTSFARALAEGDRVQVFGPRRSLRLADIAGPIVFLGDETSFGVARSLEESADRQRSIATIFEVSERAEAEKALATLDLARSTLVERRAADSHFPELERALVSELDALAGATLVLTGRAATIQFARRALKERAPKVVTQKVKAYWALGKRGLD